MPSRRERKQARRSRVFVESPTTRGTGSYENGNRYARNLDNYANRGREENGAFMRQADKARIRTAARLMRQDISNGGNEYRQGTREEVQAQRNARYRALRTAFGMSAG